MCGYAYLQSDLYPGVAEQADALVLETSIERCVSSSLTFRTIGVLPPLVKLWYIIYLNHLNACLFRRLPQVQEYRFERLYHYQ